MDLDSLKKSVVEHVGNHVQGARDLLLFYSVEPHSGDGSIQPVQIEEVYFWE